RHTTTPPSLRLPALTTRHRPCTPLARREQDGRDGGPGEARALMTGPGGESLRAFPHFTPLAAFVLPSGPPAVRSPAGRRPLIAHPALLARGELDHAGVVHVVHEVMDRVDSRAPRAAVALDAVELRSGLSRRVVHLVPASRAAVLERVVQAEPVADLVRRRVAEVVAEHPVRLVR